MGVGGRRPEPRTQLGARLGSARLGSATIVPVPPPARSNILDIVHRMGLILLEALPTPEGGDTTGPRLRSLSAPEARALPPGTPGQLIRIAQSPGEPVLWWTDPAIIFKS